MAGSLTIKGTSYDLKATGVNPVYDYYYKVSTALDGTKIVNESGNTKKQSWTYNINPNKTVYDALRTSLNSSRTGSFTDHEGNTFTSCLFELTGGTVTGNYSYQVWTLNVTEL